MNIRYLKNLRRVESRHSMIGRWVVELSFDLDQTNPTGWRRLQFGIYKIWRLAPECRSIVDKENTTGFYREYLIWLPWERVQ